MRKICMLRLLRPVRVKSFRPVREDEVSRMIQKSLKKRSETINLAETLTFLTSTTICRVALGKRYEPGSGESRELNQIIREFQIAVSAFYFTEYFPWLGSVDKLLGKIDHLEHICKKWDLFYQQLIDEHLLPDRPKSMDGDVVDIMLQLREENPKSSVLPFDHIKAVLLNMYFASTDTIATTMIWAMTALIKNPSCMKKVQAELRAYLGKKQMVEEEDIAGACLPYFNAVIKESLQLYSTIPLLVPRETIEKCTIDGFEIPAKRLVHVNAWAINRGPKQWENPTKFLPETFLEGGKSFNRDLKGQDYGFIPFGAGRRICPGTTMATVETVIANLLCLFDWELPAGVKKEDVDNDVLSGLTLHEKNPLFLMAKKSP